MAALRRRLPSLHLATPHRADAERRPDPAVALYAAWRTAMDRLDRSARPGAPWLAVLVRRAEQREAEAGRTWDAKLDELVATKAGGLQGIGAKLAAAGDLLDVREKQELPWQLVASAGADIGRLSRRK